MSSGSRPQFTDAQYQQAAAAYLASGSAPSWWGSGIQAIQVAMSGSGSSVKTTTSAPGVNAAAAAQQAWITGLATNRQGSPTQGSTATWTSSTDSDGNTVYINSATGQTSFVPPASMAPAPPGATPSIGDVSKYLQALFDAAGSGSSKPSAAQLAAIAAGSADAAWIAGLPAFRLGSGSLGSYYVGPGSGSGSGSAAGSGSGSGSAPGSGSKGSIPRRQPDNSINTPVSESVARNIRESDNSPSIPSPKSAAGPITTLLDLTNRDIQENYLFPIGTDITWFTRTTDRKLLSFVPVLQENALRGPAAFGQRFTFDLGSIAVGDLLLGTALQISLDHWLDQQSQNLYDAGKISYSSRATAWEYANSLGTSIIELAELELDGKTIETIDGDFIHTFSSLFPDYNTQVGVSYDHLGQMSRQRLLDPTRRPLLFPVENGNLNCILPFFFMRTKLHEALPMIAMREGFVKIHITLRPFEQCVRQLQGFRATCTSTPLETTFPFTFTTCTWTYTPSALNGSWDVPPPFSLIYNTGTATYQWNYSSQTNRGSWATICPVTFTTSSLFSWTASTATWSPGPPNFDFAYQDPLLPSKFYYWDSIPKAWRSGPLDAGNPAFNLTRGSNVWNSVTGDWSVAAPVFKSVQLLTYGAIVNGEFRNRMLRSPFEILHREVQTFYFEEPLKYAVGNRTEGTTIRIQLPLEANHPIEEIIWFVRRKGVGINNEWTNYSAVLESEWTALAAAGAAQRPLLQNAIIQVNGTVLCDADEQFYREGIASAHRGGYAAYSRFIYGYSFAKTPGEHQPSGSLNASRVNSLRLVLDVRPPGGILDATWEVKVFCIGLNWLRFENGLANPVFED